MNPAQAGSAQIDILWVARLLRRTPGRGAAGQRLWAGGI